MKVTDYRTLREYREVWLSRKHGLKCYPQSAIARKLRDGWQGRVSAVERGEVEFKSWTAETKAWADAYELSVRQFMRMAGNARRDSMPLFEQPPALRIVQAATIDQWWQTATEKAREA